MQKIKIKTVVRKSKERRTDWNPKSIEQFLSSFKAFTSIGWRYPRKLPFFLFYRVRTQFFKVVQKVIEDGHL